MSTGPVRIQRVNLIEEKVIQTIFELNNLKFDSENLTLTYPDSEIKKLTKKEAKILLLLVQNENKVLTRDILLNSVWGQDDYFVGRSLDVFITKLRKYVKPDERNRPEVLELKARQASKGASIVGQLLAENIRLKQLISNSPKSTVQVIKQDMVDAKVSGGQNFVTVDGGCNHHAAASGLSSIIRRPFPIVHARAPWPEQVQANEDVTIGGPLCTPIDEFGSGLSLPPIATGDLIAILASGAYGLTFSLSSFLGHATPAEVLVKSGQANIVRERGGLEDILRGQHLPQELL